MGEALITRRGNSRDKYEILSGIVEYDYSNYYGGKIYNLDFGKYDYIVHIASSNTSTGAHGDTYVVEDGVVTKEYHTDPIYQAHATLVIDKAEGSIMIVEKYSNSSVMEAGCLVVALS